jgi:hypothetical protein
VRTGILLSALLLVAANAAHACPSCFGDPDSSMTSGMNAAILILLGITGTVLAAVSAFFLYLRKRWVDVNRPFQNMLN